MADERGPVTRLQKEKYENSKRILHNQRIQRHNSQYRLDSSDARRSAGAHQSPQGIIPRRLSQHIPDAGNLPAVAAPDGQERANKEVYFTLSKEIIDLIKNDFKQI